MNYQLQGNFAGDAESPIERKTAIEWEDEMSQDDDEEEEEDNGTGGAAHAITGLPSPNFRQPPLVIPSTTPPNLRQQKHKSQPILCFDAYGNLISQSEEQKVSGTQNNDELNSYLSFAAASFQASSSDDDGGKTANTFTSTKLEQKKRKYEKKKIRFSDSQLKQVIKEDVQELVTTSRYGRERKKRTSDGFLFGTINFNELRKVTSSATTATASPKKDDNNVNVNFADILNTIPALSAPGNAPPEKILASTDSSSEAEDLNENIEIGVAKKKPKKMKASKQKSMPLSENKAKDNTKCSPSSERKSQKRKLLDESFSKDSCNKAETIKKNIGSAANKSTPGTPAKKSKLSTKKKVTPKGKQKQKAEIFMKENNEKLKSPKHMQPKLCSSSKINMGTSDEEFEASFTPRKKKKKLMPQSNDDEQDTSVLAKDLKDEVFASSLNDGGEQDSNNDEPERQTENVITIKPTIDLSKVGDIADDVRLIKNLTQEAKQSKPPKMLSKSLLEMTSPTPVKKKRGRPRKSMPSENDKEQLEVTENKPSKEKTIEPSGTATDQPTVEDSIVTKSRLNRSIDDSFNTPSPTAITKRGRQVRRPDVTDIDDLNRQQEQARLLKREEKLETPKLQSEEPPADLLDEVEVEQPLLYTEGKLVWVALKDYPLWPAISVTDKESGQSSRIETKQTVRGWSGHRAYYLYFLNDKNRAVWMRHEYVLEYAGREAMKEYLMQLKEKKETDVAKKMFTALLLKSLPHFSKSSSYYIENKAKVPSKLSKWSAAVEEAEQLLSASIEERLKCCHLVDKNEKQWADKTHTSKYKKKKKDMSRSDDGDAGTKEGTPDCFSSSRECSPSIKELFSSKSRRNRRSPSNDSDFSGFDSCSATDVAKRHKLELVKTLSKENAFELFYKIKNVSLKKEKPTLTNDEIRESLLMLWTKMSSYKKTQFFEQHLDSFDESEDISKGSTYDTDDVSECGSYAKKNSKKSSSNVDGEDLSRGTYRLPRNEKVCVKCESISNEPGNADMIKCKGVCYNFFHYVCAGFETKPDNDKEFKCEECTTGVHPCFICKSANGIGKVPLEDKTQKKHHRSKAASRVGSPANSITSNDDELGDVNVPAIKSRPRRDRRSAVNSSVPERVIETRRSSLCNTSKPKMQTDENMDVDDAENKPVDHVETIDDPNSEDKPQQMEDESNREVTKKEGEELASKIKHEQEKENKDKQIMNSEGDSQPLVKEENDDKQSNDDASKEHEDSIPEEKRADSAHEPSESEETKPVPQVVRCPVTGCGKFYHMECVSKWPQVTHSWKNNKFMCPRHMCHMCAANAEDMNCAGARSGSFTRCLRCPSTYHSAIGCLAAGSEEMSSHSHICPKHNVQSKSKTNHINVTWCFGCSKGGSLVLCDECPAAFHIECLDAPLPTEEGKGFVCEDCVNGKLPIYGDIVWAKIGQYRWWPGQVLHPRNIPDNIEKIKHSQGMLCVHFFGSDDYYWMHRGRVFHYQEGDRGCKTYTKNSLNRHFEKAIEETKVAFEAEQTNRSIREAKIHEKSSAKPPPFVKIDTNKPFGNVKKQELDLPPRCDCNPLSNSPCGPNSNCINRMLMIECPLDGCGAGERCCNQRFQRRQYPNLTHAKVNGRGWGLKTLQDIKQGDFVIEYVGELVDEAELFRRIEYMHQINEENYYFLTITKDIIIDAGPKGNLARFMNHSCEPNCETQKWQVGTETRVGLFALCDIKADSEVTFNYHFECVGTEKKKCSCGSTNCSGFIGAKVQKAEATKKQHISNGNKKRKKKKKMCTEKISEDACFRCGNPGDLLLCDFTNCPKGYHLSCLGLTNLPKGKWQCPWHHCDECGVRVSIKCDLCPNSFCHKHNNASNMFEFDTSSHPALDSAIIASLTGSNGGVVHYCADHTEDGVKEYLHTYCQTAADGGSESGGEEQECVSESGRRRRTKRGPGGGGPSSSSNSTSRSSSPSATAREGEALTKAT